MAIPLCAAISARAAAARPDDMSERKLSRAVSITTLREMKLQNTMEELIAD